MVAEAAQQLGGLHILVNSGSHPGGSATATGPIETVVDQDLLQDFNTNMSERCAVPAPSSRPTEMILTLPTDKNVAKFAAYSAAPDLR
jgi:hypothetical protein